MHTHLIEAESHLRLIIKELTAERDALKRKVHQLERKLEQIHKPKLVQNKVVNISG